MRKILPVLAAILFFTMYGCSDLPSKYVKSTCGEIIDLQPKYYKVKFQWVGKEGVTDNVVVHEWFYSTHTDTLKIGQKLCLR